MENESQRNKSRQCPFKHCPVPASCIFPLWFIHTNSSCTDFTIRREACHFNLAFYADRPIESKHYLYWFGHSEPVTVKYFIIKLEINSSQIFLRAWLIAWIYQIYLWLTVTMVKRWPNQIFWHKAKDQTLKPRWTPPGKCQSKLTSQPASLRSTTPYHTSYFPVKINICCNKTWPILTNIL